MMGRLTAVPLGMVLAHCRMVLAHCIFLDALARATLVGRRLAP